VPEIVETAIYRLNELSDEARDKARAWYRERGLDYDWFEFVYEDFERICVIFGIDLETRSVRLYGGGIRPKPCIWFSGFWSQGDGACFEARYRHAKAAARRIREYAPQDEALHSIADVLQAIQKRNFFQLHADVVRRGRYYHEYSMAISVKRESPTCQDMTADAEEVVIEALRDLARWLYRRLEQEYEYLASNEAVDEAIVANDYTFTEAGRRFG